MKTSQPVFPTLLRGFALAGLALALLAGCQSQTAAQKKQKTIEEAAVAETDFEQAAERTPTPNTFYAMARILAAQHRDAECQMMLSKIIEMKHDYLPAYNDLAELQMRQRKIDQAADTLHAGLKIAPRQAVLLNNLGMCHLFKEQYAEALANFTQASGAAPEDTRFRANMAMALGLLGRYDEALALYQQITTPADAHYNLGVIADSRNDHDRAIMEFAQAKVLEKSPADTAAKTQ